MTMYGTMHFQSSRRGYGEDAAPAAAAETPTSTKKKGLSDSQFESLISGIADIGKTAITTVGTIEQTRLTGKAPSTGVPGGGAGRGIGGGGGGGGAGIPGWVLGLGAVAVVGTVAFFALRKK